MADEAFALSPISARATQPREEDYEAISDAFMETSRGRWFLNEYAKRNRNADTRMVLDAVARIEESLAAQKQPAPESGLPEALAAIRHAIDEARAAASTALEGLAVEENLAPVRKGARVIREIAWRLREIGADGRICDLIDSQVGTIETGCAQFASIDPAAAVGAAFDLIERRISELGDGDAAYPQAAESAAPPPAPAPSDEMPAAPSEAEGPTAEDDAVLDMVAFEMAAPDPADTDIDEAYAAGLPPADPEGIAELHEPMPATPQPIPPSPQLSLGSTLIANGIVRRPNASAADPLAPIRRMSQAEKIAFFS
ncbi:MAG: hypothetical protein E7813_19555 [Bradyrhizobium sp.]|uniref:hypothetical protein n=1 Tax=Bradyrhizobium sp. TaxID=376 RepID=UPI001207EA1C|nr:hypothetical protein [Bradyrhizobium sp.]THD62758.1 MAG: hypothetical protein E7813_19555 [Bradyrhizobium sp.]